MYAPVFKLCRRKVILITLLSYCRTKWWKFFFFFVLTWVEKSSSVQSCRAELSTAASPRTQASLLLLCCPLLYSARCFSVPIEDKVQLTLSADGASFFGNKWCMPPSSIQPACPSHPRFPSHPCLHVDRKQNVSNLSNREFDNGTKWE